MSIGTVKTEEEYRAINTNSSSSLKDFVTDRKKYYKKYILKDKIKEQDSGAINMGKLVETLLMEPELFDNKFYMSSCINEPTEMMLKFIEHLYSLTIKYSEEEVIKDFEEISREAYEKSGYKLSYETVIKNFISPNKSGDVPEHYFNELIKVRVNNLIVVNTQDVTNAQNIVDELKVNFVTADIVNLTSNDRWTVLNQFQVENYEIQGLNLKSMLDKVIIDHKLKTIQPIDLKCTWNVENFYYEYYLKRSAYIQAYLYWNAMNSLTVTGGLYEGYVVKNMQFLVCDSINYMNPLIYQITNQDMLDAEIGFSYKGKDYPGVFSIIKDLKWAINNNIWNISRKNYMSKGIINLK